MPTEPSGWEIVLAPAALRNLRRLSRSIASGSRQRSSVFPPETRRLRGRSPEWRLRVGDWRVRFERDDAARRINVLAVRSRSGAYR